MNTEFKIHIKEEIFRRTECLEFDSINSVLLDLVREDIIDKYFISRKVNVNDVIVKYITVTNSNSDYRIGFENIKQEFRDFRFSKIIKKNNL